MTKTDILDDIADAIEDAREAIEAAHFDEIYWEKVDMTGKRVGSHLAYSDLIAYPLRTVYARVMAEYREIIHVGADSEEFDGDAVWRDLTWGAVDSSDPYTHMMCWASRETRYPGSASSGLIACGAKIASPVGLCDDHLTLYRIDSQEAS